MEKVQQVHKRTQTDNDGRTVIYWCEGFQIFRKASVINIYNKLIFEINATERWHAKILLELIVIWQFYVTWVISLQVSPRD